MREVEQRIERAGKRGELQGWRPTLTEPNIPRPKDGYPQDIVEHMRLMCDILVLAFQTDTTRVCTLKLNNDHGTLRFPHLGVDYMIHHLLSHSDTDDWLKVNQFFLEQMAYIARRLDAIQEGERTALDNSMIMLCSSMLNGHHDATQLPVVMLGAAGGRIQGGQNLDYLGQSESPDVSAVPQHDGQDGRASRSIRRRDPAVARGVIRGGRGTGILPVGFMGILPVDLGITGWKPMPRRIPGITPPKYSTDSKYCEESNGCQQLPVKP